MAIGAVHQGFEGSAIDTALVTAFVEVMEHSFLASLFGFFQTPAVDGIEDSGNGFLAAGPGGLDATPSRLSLGSIVMAEQIGGLGQSHGLVANLALQGARKLPVEIAPAMEAMNA